MMRDDPELGPVRVCSECRDEWPFDGEFWYIIDGRLDPNRPARCRACMFDYYAKRRRIRQVIVRENRRLPEPIPGRCNVPMQNHDRCGRRMRHDLEHRSQTAMGHDRDRKAASRLAA